MRIQQQAMLQQWILITEHVVEVLLLSVRHKNGAVWVREWVKIMTLWCLPTPFARAPLGDTATYRKFPRMDSARLDLLNLVVPNNVT